MAGAEKAGDQELQPLRRPQQLEPYIGRWVAMKEGKVVADAATSSELAEAVIALGDAGEDAEILYVSPPSKTWMVGVG